MKITNFFIPIKKETPSDAEIISHQLMIKAGMIEKHASGLYSLLPLGLKVVQNISKIIRQEHEKINSVEILMPILQPATLWQESGRYDDYGKEMLRVKDRHNRDMLFGPTNEEVVTDIFRKHVKTYKQLPINLYQLQWKFRDEIRPRFGIMRSREFLMKDAYSFDIDEDQALETYKKYFSTYLNIFNKLGVTAIPVQANNGAIGGSLSHEFHILADTGESQIYADQELFNQVQNNNYNFDELSEFYSAADEMHNNSVSDQKIISKRGIEVGHIFNFATKYSTSMKAMVMDQNSQNINVNMGSYGIGISRVVAAIIEASHDEYGIIWPKNIAPFRVVINPMQKKNVELFNKALEIYQQLKQANIEVLLDDSDKSAGEKFATHDLIGVPLQVIIGTRSLANNQVEIKIRKNSQKELVDFSSIIPFIVKNT
jgi:prolyl-tRNA synthetase